MNPATYLEDRAERFLAEQRFAPNPRFNLILARANFEAAARWEDDEVRRKELRRKAQECLKQLYP